MRVCRGVAMISSAVSAVRSKTAAIPAAHRRAGEALTEASGLSRDSSSMDMRYRFFAFIFGLRTPRAGRAGAWPDGGVPIKRAHIVKIPQ